MVGGAGHSRGQHGPAHQEGFGRSMEPAPPAEAASFSSCLHPAHRAHLRTADSHHGPCDPHMAQVPTVNWASCRQTGPAWGPGWGTHIVDFKHESRENAELGGKDDPGTCGIPLSLKPLTQCKPNLEEK